MLGNTNESKINESFTPGENLLGKDDLLNTTKIKTGNTQQFTHFRH